MELNLLAMLVLGLGGGVLGLFGMMRSAWLQSRVFQCAPLAVALTAATLAALSDSPLFALLPLALIITWLLVCFNHKVLSQLNRIGVWLRKPAVTAASLFVVSPLLAVLWSYLADPAPPYWDPPASTEQVAMIPKRAVPDAKVKTDAGRILPVALPSRSATSEEVELLKHRSALPNVICTDGPGTDYNCHGWVFTGGKFWINSSQVREILDDNGYQAVAQPQAGDVIVYLVKGEVVHTGIVRSADANQVLVESKWGLQGRFIHTAENQEYSQEFVYYRSDRRGHLLQGLDDGAPRHHISHSESIAH